MNFDSNSNSNEKSPGKKKLCIYGKFNLKKFTFNFI